MSQGRLRVGDFRYYIKFSFLMWCFLLSYLCCFKKPHYLNYLNCDLDSERCLDSERQQHKLALPSAQERVLSLGALSHAVVKLIEFGFANTSGPNSRLTQVSRISLPPTSSPPHLVLVHSFKLHNFTYF